MAQLLRASIAFVEELSLVPRTHIGGLQPPMTLAPADPMPLASIGPCPHSHIFEHTHVIYNNTNEPLSKREKVVLLGESPFFLHFHSYFPSFF